MYMYIYIYILSYRKYHNISTNIMQYLQKTVPTHHTSPQKLWIDGSKTITRPDLGRCHTQLASVLDRHTLSASAWVTTKHTYNSSTSFYLLLFHHVSTWDMSLRISLNCQADSRENCSNGKMKMWKPASQLRVIGFKGVFIGHPLQPLDALQQRVGWFSNLGFNVHNNVHHYLTASDCSLSHSMAFHGSIREYDLRLSILGLSKECRIGTLVKSKNPKTIANTLKGPGLRCNQFRTDYKPCCS
jgi:hypothetical protein